MTKWRILLWVGIGLLWLGFVAALIGVWSTGQLQEHMMGTVLLFSITGVIATVVGSLGVESGRSK